jgi:hypothetical protein
VFSHARESKAEINLFPHFSDAASTPSILQGAISQNYLCICMYVCMYVYIYIRSYHVGSTRPYHILLLLLVFLLDLIQHELQVALQWSHAVQTMMPSTAHTHSYSSARNDLYENAFIHTIMSLHICMRACSKQYSSICKDARVCGMHHTVAHICTNMARIHT